MDMRRIRRERTGEQLDGVHTLVNQKASIADRVENNTMFARIYRMIRMRA
jgi:hypothetical protein